jgi:hypothetical protein
LNLDVRQDGAFAWALVGLEPGEEFVSEAGAMFRRDAHVEVDVTVRHRGGGGILGGLGAGSGGCSPASRSSSRRTGRSVPAKSRSPRRSRGASACSNSEARTEASGTAPAAAS